MDAVNRVNNARRFAPDNGATAAQPANADWG